MARLSNAFINYAKKMQQTYAMPASAALAQCIQESDGGKTNVAVNANNCLGITGTGPAGSYKGFRKYSDFLECFLDYGRIISSSDTYASARAKLPDVEAFIKEIAKHYAEDPNYANEVIAIWKQYNLSQYDTVKAVESTKDVASVAEYQYHFVNGRTGVGSWYGAGSKAWCAYFASWCGNEAGYAGSATPPYPTSSVDGIRTWFQKQGRYRSRDSYTPKRNDYVIYKANGASHTGIVISFDGSTLYTIEGNYSNTVKSRKIAVGSRGNADLDLWSEISGWGLVHDYITSADESSTDIDTYEAVTNESYMDVSTRTVDFDLATIQVILYPSRTGTFVNDEGDTKVDENGWMMYKPKVFWRKKTDTAAAIIFDDIAVGFEPANTVDPKSWYIFLDGLEPDTDYVYTVQMLWKSASSSDWALGALKEQTLEFHTRASDTADPDITLMLQLYPMGETKFESAGLGGLPDATEALVSETINGEFDLEMKYPVDGVNFDELKVGRIITARAQPNKGIDAFRISDIEHAIDGISTITAHHVSYDFSYTECASFHAESVDEAICKIRHRSSILNANIPHRLRLDDYSGKNIPVSFDNFEVNSLRSVLYKLLDASGYEIGWHLWHAYLYEKRGIRTDYQINYGHNLKDFKLSVSFDEYYTAVNTIFNKTDTVTLNEGTDQEKSTTHTTSIFGNEIDKTSESIYPFKRLYLLDVSSGFSSSDGDVPSKEQMDELRDSWIDSHGLNVPEITLDASFIDLSDTYNYSNLPLEYVNIGDKVTVNVPEMGFQVKARVIKTVYDCINERFETITVGNAVGDIASTLTSSTAAIKDKITATDAKSLANRYSAEKMREDLANKLAEKNGLFMTTEDDGNGGKIFYLHDQKLLQDSSVIWKMTRDAFGVSTDGGKTWNAGLTVDGNLIAKILTTTGVNANWIRTGNIQDRTGNSYWNLDTGEMKLIAEAPDEMLEKIETEYYLSDSDTTQSGSEWSSDQPSWTKGRYIWSRVKYTHKDKTVTYSDPVLMIMINGAYEGVDGLNETQTEALKEAMTQQSIFNALTNGQKDQGIYLQDGKLYLNGTYFQSNTVTAKNILLFGDMSVFTDANGSTIGGWLGYGKGRSDNGETEGMHIVSQNGKAEVITTTAGSRMSYGNNADTTQNSRIYVTDSGSYVRKSENGLCVDTNGSSFDGPVNFNGYVNVDGGATFDNATVYVNKGLDVKGGETIRSSLKINSSDDSAAFALIGEDGINLNNTVTVSSPSTLNANGGLNVSGGAEITSSLNVKNDSTIFLHSGTDGSYITNGTQRLNVNSNAISMTYDNSDSSAGRIYVTQAGCTLSFGSHKIVVNSSGVYIDDELYDKVAVFG